MVGVGWVVGLVLALAVPAFAKGVYQVTLIGGGQEVTFTGTALSSLPESIQLSIQLYDGLWGDGERVARPTGDLGPRITALWLFSRGAAEGLPIVQYLYPFAEGGPVGLIPGGQAFFGGDRVVEAWFSVADALTDDLAAVGFDLTLLNPTAKTVVATTSTAPAAVVVGDVTPVAQAAEALSTTDSGWSPLAALGLIGAVVVAVLVARSSIMRRRDQRMV